MQRKMKLITLTGPEVLTYPLTRALRTLYSLIPSPFSMRIKGEGFD